MKHFVLAAATVLCAAGAMASNFRVADSVYIPIGAHAAGGSGTFISDVWVQNMDADEAVDVSVIYTRIGTRDINSSPCPADPGPNEVGCPKYFNNRFRLQPGERREFIDFLLLPLSQGGLGLDVAQGLLIFNGCLANADCINTQDDTGFSVNYRNISVFSRVYSIPPGTNLTDNPAPRTVGQTFPGIPWYNYVSSTAQPVGLGRVVITGIRNTGVEPGTYRTNIGLVNASQYSTTTIVVKLFNGTTRAQIGGDYTVRLGPLQSVQPAIGNMFPAFVAAPTSTNAYVTIEQRDNTPTNDSPAGCLQSGGCPGFLAFGTILDNLSGDGTTLEAIYEIPLDDDDLKEIYLGKTGGPIRRAVRR